MRDKSRYILKLAKSLFKCRNFTYQEPKAEKHTLNHHSQPPLKQHLTLVRQN